MSEYTYEYQVRVFPVNNSEGWGWLMHRYSSDGKHSILGPVPGFPYKELAEEDALRYIRHVEQRRNSEAVGSG